MLVGLTGGIGSGKTTVAEMFRQLNVPVYESDEEAKSLMHSSKTVRNAIIGLFGEQAYTKGRLNRKLIAERVFGDKQLLAQLNQIVHPAVKDHFFEWMSVQDAPYVIQETALIFENDMQDRYDKIVLVTAPMTARIERVTKRDGVSEEEVMARIENQLDDKSKIECSDFVIENSDLETTEKEVGRIHAELLKIFQERKI